jgi:hypothetical protein
MDVVSFIDDLDELLFNEHIHLNTYELEAILDRIDMLHTVILKKLTPGEIK